MKSLVLGLVIFFLASSQASAASDYVLPYPGLMPGHRLYQAKQVFDQLGRFWAWGSLSRYKYELALADKKLVEAKVLFEYRQYLLATKALKTSDGHFQKALEYLEKAKKEGKDTAEKTTNLREAAEKHQEVLKNLQPLLPKEFLWQPEKEAAVELNLESAIEAAIKKREF